MKNMLRLSALGAAAALALTACSNSADSSENPSSSSPTNSATSDSGALQVSASFYPIAWLTEQIGGDNVQVNLVTPANIEPHDFELAPADIVRLESTDAIIYVEGFQPSLDDAVATISGPTIVDLSGAVDLVAASEEEDHDHADDADHAEDADHTEDADHADEDGHDHGAFDPHFWLDPERMSSAAEAIADELTALDPDSAETYAANLATTQDALDKLNQEFATSLQSCDRDLIVTTHAAFGYLSSRYGLEQVSISGIDPESEPSPATIASVKKIIEESGTTTVFTEELVSPKTAEALADEAGVQTAVLNPLESQPESGDYLTEMRVNLDELRAALSCK